MNITRERGGGDAAATNRTSLYFIRLEAVSSEIVIMLSLKLKLKSQPEKVESLVKIFHKTFDFHST